MSRILVIDDDRALGRSLEIHLGKLGHDVRTTASAADGLSAFNQGAPEVVFLDLDLPDRSGLDLLPDLVASPHPTAVIMITGVQDMSATIDAIRAGALDYIRKPLDLDDLTLAVEKASRHLRSLAAPAAVPVAEAPARAGPREIVGRSRAIVEVIKQIGLLSRSRVTVLIQGESGTGKELVARAVHEAGSPGAPFVAVNCSAVVPALLESELFGHERGAFTGADATKVGKLEHAGQGTVFFDEIGDLALDLQAKLLRAIQEREFERVGGVKPLPLRARIVAATNRDLARLVREERFREDLFFRLSVAPITVPPLRERREDIPLIVRHLMARICRELGREPMPISDGAMAKLEAEEWPGNVRELENSLRRAIALSRSNVIEADVLDLGSARVDPGASAAGAAVTEAVSGAGADGVKPLREVERDAVLRALTATGWNISRTARLLDISPTTLRKKITDYGLRSQQP